MTGQPIPNIGVHQACGRRWIDHNNGTCPDSGTLTERGWRRVDITIAVTMMTMTALVVVSLAVVVLR